MAAAAVVGAAATGAWAVGASAGDGSGATASREGWWSATAGLPSSVPDKALAVGAQLGAADKVAALGLAVSLAPGARLDGLALAVREAAEPGANVNPDNGAAITACPITSEWSPARNAPLAAAPRANCDLGRADGARSPDGTWRFDLTALGKLWTTSLAQHGVLLMEKVDAPATFQLSFEGISSTTGVRVELRTSDGRGPAAADALPAASAGTQGAPSPPSAAAGGGATPGLSLDTPLPLAGPPGTGGAGTGGSAPPVTASPAPTVGQGQPVSDPQLWGNLPPATALLVPVVLGFGLLVCHTLGPAGDPPVSSRRQGAVSRALSPPAVGSPASPGGEAA